MKCPEHLQGLTILCDGVDWLIYSNGVFRANWPVPWDDIPDDAQLAISAAAIITPPKHDNMRCTLHGRVVRVWSDAEVWVRLTDKEKADATM